MSLQMLHNAGHGSDENNCAEFCVTNHRFSINGREHWVNFTQAGTAWGCTTKVKPILLHCRLVHMLIYAEKNIKHIVLGCFYHMHAFASRQMCVATVHLYVDEMVQHNCLAHKVHSNR